MDAWVATLFRPFPGAGDLDRLIAAVTGAVESATGEADARTGALACAVDMVARDYHAARHAGLFAECAETPCASLREALAAARLRPADPCPPQSA